MNFDARGLSPMDWDNIADGILDIVDDEIRAAELLLKADPPLAVASIPHSIMAVEQLLYLTVQFLGAPPQPWDGTEEYIKFIAEKDPELRKTLGPLSAIKKAVDTGPFDEDVHKVAEAAFKAAVKTEKTLSDFVDKTLEKLYTEQDASAPPPPPLFSERTPPSKERMQAMELVDMAWEEPSIKKRATLVKKALSLDPDLADAHVILGNDALDKGKFKEAVEHYIAGSEAGEREIEKEIGPNAFEEMKGRFWMAFETRPFMRALFGLAAALRKLGATVDAAAHYRKMLELNPNDNQGARYSLMEALLSLGKHDEAEELFKEYDEETAFWLYSKALLDFQKGGDSEQAQKSRSAAIESNPHVPAYLLGKKKTPKKMPEKYGMGDNNEAVIYAIEYAEAWRTTEGALEWLSDGV